MHKFLISLLTLIYLLAPSISFALEDQPTAETVNENVVKKKKKKKHKKVVVEDSADNTDELEAKMQPETTVEPPVTESTAPTPHTVYLPNPVGEETN